MVNKSKSVFILTIIFVIIFSNFSLAQETPNHITDEKLALETSDPQFTEINLEPSPSEEINLDVGGNGHNESTYYMNSRPADFIQVVNTNGTEINETYIYLQDKLIAKIDTNGRKFFYHPDHLGSTSLVTNESGDVVEDLLYLPYGCILSGNEISRFGFTGQENDKESGFIDYGARQYDCEFSRFLQTDPVIADIYNPQNLNRYAYVLNNPYKYVDPNGESPLLATALIGAGIGTIGSITYQLATTGEVNAKQVAISAGAGAIAGLTGFGVATAISSAIGSSATSMAASIGVGALSGSVAGEAGQFTSDTLSGQDYTFDPGRAATNAVIGGIVGGVGNKLSSNSEGLSSDVKSINKNTQSHILQEKHGWENIVDNPRDWKQVSSVINQVVKDGRVSKEGNIKGVYSATSSINGNNVKVTYRYINNQKKISNAYVTRNSRKGGK